jgi:hypothetical protein
LLQLSYTTPWDTTATRPPTRQRASHQFLKKPLQQERRRSFAEFFNNRLKRVFHAFLAMAGALSPADFPGFSRSRFQSNAYS